MPLEELDEPEPEEPLLDALLEDVEPELLDVELLAELDPLELALLELLEPEVDVDVLELAELVLLELLALEELLELDDEVPPPTPDPPIPVPPVPPSSVEMAWHAGLVLPFIGQHAE